MLIVAPRQVQLVPGDFLTVLMALSKAAEGNTMHSVAGAWQHGLTWMPVLHDCASLCVVENEGDVWVGISWGGVQRLGACSGVVGTTRHMRECGGTMMSISNQTLRSDVFRQSRAFFSDQGSSCALVCAQVTS